MKRAAHRTPTIPMRMHGPASRVAVAGLVACVNVAFASGVGVAVAAVMEPLIAKAPVAIVDELLTIAELARHDIAIARMCWTSMLPALLEGAVG
jgi:hypothetical protein